MSEPTSRALWGRGPGCFSEVGTHFQGIVGQVCRLFKWCRNTPPRHCAAVVQVFQAVSETTSRALWGRGPSCLRCVETCLLGTEWQGCRLLKWCQSLPPEHCGVRGQAIQVVSEPTAWALWGRGLGCFSEVGTYFQGTVRQGCRLFKWCWNLPPRHRGAGVQAV